MRLFIAIELNDRLKNKLAVIQDKVKASSVNGKYTDLDNFHLTLHFIGEVNEIEKEKIEAGIEKVAEEAGPFELVLDSLGHFPKKTKHILWAGVKGDIVELHELNQSIRLLLDSKLSKDEDIKYTPHITLGRKIELSGSFNELKKEIEVSTETIEVTSISLMESKRENGKLVYNSIFSRPLVGSTNRCVN